MAEKWLSTNFEALGLIAVSAAAIYVAVLLYTRLLGLRSFAKMSAFDFAITIAVGSILASVALLFAVSLTEGLFALAVVYLLQGSVSFLRSRTSWATAVFDNEPILLMRGSEILDENLKEGQVTREDLFGKLREANVRDLNQVDAVVLESTGDVSVLHTSREDTDLDDIVLTGVRSEG
ncbi:MAG: DUF421 domain-containing protein [Solirubrobacterales bacterium]